MTKKIKDSDNIRLNEDEFKREFKRESQQLGLTPKEFIHGLLSSNIKNEPQQDIRNEMYAEIIRTLHADDKLLQMSRITQEYGYYITKLLIVELFYYDYWKNVKLTYDFLQTNVPPYYKVNHTVDYAKAKPHINKAFNILIKDLLKLPISYGGLGRNDIKELVKSMDSRLREEELIKQRSMFGGVDMRSNVQG